MIVHDGKCMIEKCTMCQVHDGMASTWWEASTKFSAPRRATVAMASAAQATEGEFLDRLDRILFLFFVSDYLLELWDLEEKNRQKSKKVDNVADADADADVNLFNDRQWKDQWYMVSSVDIFR